MKLMSKLGVWTFAATLVFTSAACKNTATGMKQDAEQNKREAAEMSDEAKAKAEAGAEKTENAAERAADQTVGTAGAAVQTADVKAALIADSRVDAIGIDVDTDYATKTVTLKGHVPTAAQKTIAAEIAGHKAEGYSVKNELVVK